MQVFIGMRGNGREMPSSDQPFWHILLTLSWVDEAGHPSAVLGETKAFC